MRLLQLTVGAAVTLGVWLLLARILTVFGGVGSVELAILFAPALIAGLWAGRASTHRARSSSRSHENSQ